MVSDTTNTKAHPSRRAHPKKEVIRMYEYEVMNRQTEEVMDIYGYNVVNAFSRLAHLEKFATPNDWIVTNTTYID